MTFKMTSEDQTITVYNLREDTQEFIGKGDAFIPAFTGLPANCTTITPPEIKAGYIALFNAAKQKWTLSEDHRGETVFSTDNGRAISIDEPGSYPVGTTTVAPEKAWQKWNGKNWIDDEGAEKTALIAEAHAKKSGLLADANPVIATLQDAVDLEMATDKEITLLTAWKKYRVLLSRIDTSDPENIVWPDKPE